MKIFNSLLIVVTFMLAGCAHFDDYSGDPQWDFDHKVQFRQTKLTENRYHLEVVAGGDTNFKTLATFVLRQGSKICRSEHFTLEILQGIESYTHKQSFPNLISSDLIANIQCSSENN